MKEVKYEPSLLKTEGDVEVKFVAELFTKNLGYDSNKDLKWKEPIKYKMGRKEVTKFADLVVYKNNTPVIVVESKNPTESLTQNIGQVDSYSFAKETRYSIITNGRKLILREYLAGNKRINIINNTLSELKNNKFETLYNLIAKNKINIDIEKPNKIIEIQSNKITDYRRFFRSIHNIIRDNEKLDPVGSFDEFSKILYLKMANELYKNDNDEKNYFVLTSFTNVPNVKPMTLINDWFKQAMKRYYKDVFEEIPELKVGLNTLGDVLKKLNGFYVKDESMDIKGRAFEAFLPSQLRGKGLGQFFTPRKIVDFMVDLAEVDINDIVVDFACGSGGFLIKSFDIMKQNLNALPSSTFTSIGTTKEKYEDSLKKNQIFGIDAEARAVRVAKMNMILWGDGKRVVRGNGLLTTDWTGKPYDLKEYDANDPKSGCTLILANPPFIKEKNINVLARYELAEGKNSVDAQTLFLERGIKLLRPGGRMLIVLPEGVLSNSTAIKTREYILRNSLIKAIVELPTHTFVQSGVDTINTVVLYIEKFEVEQKNIIDEILCDDPAKNIEIIKDLLNYDIFISSAENVGFEPNGRVFVKDGEQTDLDKILEKYYDINSIIKKQDIITKTKNDYFSDEKNLRGSKNNHDFMRLNIKETNNRLDPSYYLFWKNISNKFDKFIPLKNYKIKFHNEKLNLITEDDLDKEYCVVSVKKSNMNNEVEFDSFKTGDELSKETTKKKIIREGTIAYNPYRANIGSFGIVSDELKGSVTSGAYVNFSVKDFNAQLLITLFKTPIYNKYINILATGTVRNNFSEDCLNEILVPKLNKDEQIKLLKKFNNYDEEIRNQYELLKSKSIQKLDSIYNEVKI